MLPAADAALGLAVAHDAVEVEGEDDVGAGTGGRRASARAIVDIAIAVGRSGARAGRSVQRRGATAEARATGIGARTTNDMELCRPESQAGTVAPLVVPTLAAVSANN